MLVEVGWVFFRVFSVVQPICVGFYIPVDILGPLFLYFTLNVQTHSKSNLFEINKSDSVLRAYNLSKKLLLILLPNCLI